MRCKDHKNYKVARKPSVNCVKCWEIWKENLESTIEEIEEAVVGSEYDLCCLEDENDIARKKIAKLKAKK